MKKYILPFCLTICITTVSKAQNINVDSSRLNELFGLYRQSAGKKDFLSAKKYLDTALMIIPDYSGGRYAHIRVSLRAGLKEDALSDINQLINQSAVIVKGIQTDSLIKAELGNDARFIAYQKNLSRFDETVNRSTVAFDIPDKLLVPEGITNDPVTKTIYLGSTYQRKVISIDKNGIIKDFIKSKQDDIQGVLGLAIDARRRILYACSGFLQGIDSSEVKDRRTAVYAFDINTGQLLQKYTHEKGSSFNDLDIAPNGDVYVTDSDGDKVYRISNEKKVMEIFIERPHLQSPNGITFNNTGDLFIAAYLGGILKVNMKTGSKTWITKPDSISLSGNDGMEWYQNSLIINSPIEHKAIRRLYLNKEQTAIIKEEFLAYNPSIIYECTTGTIMDDTFYFIGNSGMDAYERNGSLNKEKVKNSVIRKVVLK